MITKDRFLVVLREEHVPEKVLEPLWIKVKERVQLASDAGLPDADIEESLRITARLANMICGVGVKNDTEAPDS
jgi:hypothetical protein